MWTIKSNYQVNPKDMNAIANDFNSKGLNMKNEFYLKSNTNLGNRVNSKISNGSFLNEEIKKVLSHFLSLSLF